MTVVALSMCTFESSVDSDTLKFSLPSKISSISKMTMMHCVSPSLDPDKKVVSDEILR